MSTFHPLELHPLELQFGLKNVIFKRLSTLYDHDNYIIFFFKKNNGIMSVYKNVYCGVSFCYIFFENICITSTDVVW